MTWSLHRANTKRWAKREQNKNKNTKWDEFSVWRRRLLYFISWKWKSVFRDVMKLWRDVCGFSFCISQISGWTVPPPNRTNCAALLLAVRRVVQKRWSLEVRTVLLQFAVVHVYCEELKRQFKMKQQLTFYIINNLICQCFIVNNKTNRKK